MSNAWWSAFLGGVIAEIVIIALFSGVFYYGMIVKKGLEKVIPQYKNDSKKQFRWWLLWSSIHCLLLLSFIVMFLVVSQRSTAYAQISILSVLVSLIMILPINIVRFLVETHKSME